MSCLASTALARADALAQRSCLEIHRERLALSNSMRDIDSAVGRCVNSLPLLYALLTVSRRLDSIIMSLWYVVSILIIAGLLNASFNTMIASYVPPFLSRVPAANATARSAGTLVLGLSWLIGTTAQEILASIIFLFIKHVYDVGDRVDIDGISYVVMEMHLLSTIFKRVDGMIVQVRFRAEFVDAGAEGVVCRRRTASSTPSSCRTSVGRVPSPSRSLGTSTSPRRSKRSVVECAQKHKRKADLSCQIEALRTRMLEFLEVERRDFIPQIDIAVASPSSSFARPWARLTLPGSQISTARASSPSPPTSSSAVRPLRSSRRQS